MDSFLTGGSEISSTRSAAEILTSIFSPGDALQDPRQFAGRDLQIRELLLALGSARRLPVVSGSTGIGKTSLLYMVRDIFTNETSVLTARKLQSLAPLPASRLVIVMRCSRDLESPLDLATRMLFQLTRSFSSPSKARQWSIRSFEVSATLPIGSLKGAWERVTTDGPGIAVLADGLQALMRESAIDEIIVMLDECEQLPWLPGLLDFTREFETPGIRFVLAMRDYGSRQLAKSKYGDYRWPITIDVPELSKDEVSEVFSSAAARLQREARLNWRLKPESVTYIKDHSAGEPWYLQMIGSELIENPDLRFEDKIVVGSAAYATHEVRLQEVHEAELRLVTHRLHSLHSDDYRQITRRAPKREELIRMLAQYRGTVIPQEFIRHVAQTRLSNAFRILTDLQERFPQVLETTPEGNLQFAEHQFRVYCRLAPASDDLIDVTAREVVKSYRY